MTHPNSVFLTFSTSDYEGQGRNANNWTHGFPSKYLYGGLHRLNYYPPRLERVVLNFGTCSSWCGLHVITLTWTSCKARSVSLWNSFMQRLTVILCPKQCLHIFWNLHLTNEKMKSGHWSIVIGVAIKCALSHCICCRCPPSSYYHS